MNAFDFFFENTSELKKIFLKGKEETSYIGLHNSSLELATWLRQEYGENRNVIIMSNNDLFFVTSYLAIIKSGNVCIPLDPYIESDNFHYIYNITKPVAIFAPKRIIQKLNLESKNWISPELISRIKVKDNLLSKKKDFKEDRCAEIIFTSGSTGTPKGVMISHKNLIANTSSIVEYLGLTENDRMLVVLPFYYCYGLSLLHTHLRVGGSIVFNNSFIFLGGVIRDLKDFRCTGFAGVPSHFQILLRKSDSFKTTSFPDLNYVTQAGGQLAPVFINEFREVHPEIKFFVMYGQTEATARLSCLKPEQYEMKKGSIGRAIPGVELKVINKDGLTVKPGETGEVVARGDNVMLGYFADVESTRYTIQKGWLHTGDLGNLDEDGYIYLTARKNEIIKVRGRRVSPKEIEAVILELEDVVDCSIHGVDDELQGESLKATIVINKAVSGEERVKLEDQIKKHCLLHLSGYKVPTLFEFKDRIKISATGKKTENMT